MGKKRASIPERQKLTSISYVTITARADYPTVGRPSLHLFEPTLQTLKNQTFTDFEYIVCDVFYDKRPEYFIDHNYGLQIKHIPAAPNIWQKYGLVQTCHQFNKGIIHADGELLFFDADSSMLHPNLMENLWSHYQEGVFVSLGFGSDLTFTPELKRGTWQGATMKDARTNVVPTEWYRFLGYNGLVIMDHRYRKLFENNSLETATIPPDWYYGISTVSMEAALKVNGFNQAFDGDSALNDVDFGNRLVIAGFDRLAMFRDSYVVEAYAGTQWNPQMRTVRPEIKCNNGLLLYNKISGRFRANEPYSKADLDYVINFICGKYCPVKDKCRTLKHRGPFFNKNEKELYDYWLKHGSTLHLDLELEREMRIDGEEDLYVEGTFVNI